MNRTWALLGVLAFIGGFSALPSRAALEEHDCAGTPPEAVMALPAPLSKWGRIACTTFGHILASHEGWVWAASDASQTVFVPSQLGDGPPKPLGNSSYFTKIEVAPVSGEEFDRAYERFHDGFDQQEAKPNAYRVDLTSVSGRMMRLYFFDYDTYAWGMWCPGNDCSTDSRFMILDKSHRPTPRLPPI